MVNKKLWYPIFLAGMIITIAFVMYCEEESPIEVTEWGTFAWQSSVFYVTLYDSIQGYGHGEVTLGWQLLQGDPEGSGFVVEKRVAGEASYTVLDTIPLSFDSFTDGEGIEGDTQYDYRLSILDDGQEEVHTWSEHTLPYLEIFSPGTIVHNPDSVIFQWGAVSGFTAYHLMVNEFASFDPDSLIGNDIWNYTWPGTAEDTISVAFNADGTADSLRYENIYVVQINLVGTELTNTTTGIKSFWVTPQLGPWPANDEPK